MKKTRMLLLADNTARDLGVYNCQEPAGYTGNISCKTITNYSGWAVDQVNAKIYMFGGGHASTSTTTMMVFTASMLTWASDSGPSTPCTDMTQANWDVTNVWWRSTQQPTAQHTYQSMVYFPGKDTIARLRHGQEGGAACTPAGWGTWSGTGERIHEYNTLTHKWTPTTVSPSATQFAVATYDPPSGLAISIGSGADEMLRTYDINTKVFTNRKNFFSVGDIGYANHLVYYPPNQKHYLFDRNHSKIWELTLDRTNWTNSTLVNVTGITGAYPTAAGETGWDYDSDNQIICGAVRNGTITCYKPETKTFMTQTILREAGSTAAIGSVNPSHTFAYLQAAHAFFWISTIGAPSQNRTWMYRYRNP